MKKPLLERPVSIGAVVCHPPLILPRIGRGQERRLQVVTDAYWRIVQSVREARPQTIVILSPHAPSYIDYIQIASKAVLRGDMDMLGDPADSFRVDNDRLLVKEIARLAKAENFPMGTAGRQDGKLDHGTMVPLYFFKPLLEAREGMEGVKVVRIATGGLSSLDHYKAGQLIQKAAARLGRRIAVIASADLSHCQKEGSLYGFRACGPEYDAKIMDIMSQARFDELLDIPEREARDALVCGHRAMCMLAGSLDGFQTFSQALCHSAEFGVGYGLFQYVNPKPDPSRTFYQAALEKRQNRWSERLATEDAWISLARAAIDSWVKTGSLPPLPDDLPASMLNERAGVFVSLHRNGELCGCLGTTRPTQKNIAEEIRSSAVLASSKDSRFFPLVPKELEELEISVDILSEPELCSMEDLDPARYGMTIEKDIWRALLLPGLPGIETVEQQVLAAKKKACLSEFEEDCIFHRFEVERHGV